MQIIYDESKALSRKEEIDEEVDKENQRRKKENKKLFIITATITLTVIAIIVTGMFVTQEIIFGEDIPLILQIVSSVIFPLLAVLVAAIIYDNNSWELECPEYPADIKLLIKTQDKNILRLYEQEKGEHHVWVYADVEDDRHRVESICIAQLKIVSCTNLAKNAEPVADLAADEYCIPYQCTGKELN